MKQRANETWSTLNGSTHTLIPPHANRSKAERRDWLNTQRSLSVTGRFRQSYVPLVTQDGLSFPPPNIRRERGRRGSAVAEVNRERGGEAPVGKRRWLRTVKGLVSAKIGKIKWGRGFGNKRWKGRWGREKTATAKQITYRIWWDEAHKAGGWRKNDWRTSFEIGEWEKVKCVS